VERIEEAPGHDGGLVRETRPRQRLAGRVAGTRQIDHRRSTGYSFSNAISSGWSSRLGTCPAGPPEAPPEGCTYSDPRPDQQILLGRSGWPEPEEPGGPVWPDNVQDRCLAPVDGLDPPSWPQGPSRSSELEERPGYGPIRGLCAPQGPLPVACGSRDYDRGRLHHGIG
jgi:hypothetical protein